MTNKPYQFNPEDFGYEPSDNFPELASIERTSAFIKVIRIAGESFPTPTYWYSSCQKSGSPASGRWTFDTFSFQLGVTPNLHGKSRIYDGLITSHEFAEQLLSHLFSDSGDDSIEVTGVPRLSSRINNLRLPQTVA